MRLVGQDGRHAERRREVQRAGVENAPVREDGHVGSPEPPLHVDVADVVVFADGSEVVAEHGVDRRPVRVRRPAGEQQDRTVRGRDPADGVDQHVEALVRSHLAEGEHGPVRVDQAEGRTRLGARDRCRVDALVAGVGDADDPVRVQRVVVSDGGGGVRVHHVHDVGGGGEVPVERHFQLEVPGVVGEDVVDRPHEPGAPGTCRVDGGAEAVEACAGRSEVVVGPLHDRRGPVHVEHVTGAEASEVLFELLEAGALEDVPAARPRRQQHEVQVRVVP